MSLPKVLGRGKDDGSLGGHRFGNVNIGRGARVQLGDTYHLDDPLNSLPYAVDAPFDSYYRQHEPPCLENTRVDVLQQIFDWADGQDERCIFWLNGLAGTGKSTIARTVARKYSEQKCLGASFFFSRGGGDTGHAGMFFTSIAVQLANHAPPLQPYIYEAIRERSDIASKSLHDQWRQLVFGPISKLNSNSCRPTYILIVDALDECDDEKNIRIILHLLAEARALKPTQLRIFITSRPDTPIRHGVSELPGTEHRDFILHNISPATVDHDISVYLEHHLGIIGQDRTMEAGWPGEEAIRCLIENACGLFIWAATACRFICEGRKTQIIKSRLSSVLQSSGSITEPAKHLNEIYTTVLGAPIATFSDEERQAVCVMLRHILGSIVVLLSPLSAHSLSRLLQTPKKDIDETLEDLHAILDIPADPNRLLRLHHPSFRDFLLDKDRCGDPHFWVDEKQAHQTLADRCLRLMSACLKQDICGQNTPGVLVADVESTQVEQCLPPEVQYACLYWIQHLQKGSAQLSDNDQVHRFLKGHLLHWLEALSWMRKVSDGIYAIASLGLIAPMTNGSTHLAAFLEDARRFILANRYICDSAPLQLYSAAIVFAPENSIIRNLCGRVPSWIQQHPVTPRTWSAELQTLEGHTGSVSAVAFSPDGSQLSSASDDRTVRLWNAKTGREVQKLEGHTDLVSAVAFSSDGSQLASASNDRTVRLWNAKTGREVQKLEGHSGSVSAVAFSPDGSQLASASWDGTVRLWNAKTGQKVQKLEVSLGIHEISFSDDGQTLVTNRGSIYVGATRFVSAFGRRKFGNNLVLKEDWIEYGNRRVLWLPHQYRSDVSAVHDNMLAIGRRSGLVSFLQIQQP